MELYFNSQRSREVRVHSDMEELKSYTLYNEYRSLNQDLLYSITYGSDVVCGEGSCVCVGEG